MRAAPVMSFPQIALRLGCTTHEVEAAYWTGIRKIRSTRMSHARALAKQMADIYEQTSAPHKLKF